MTIPLYGGLPPRIQRQHGTGINASDEPTGFGRKPDNTRGQALQEENKKPKEGKSGGLMIVEVPQKNENNKDDKTEEA